MKSYKLSLKLATILLSLLTLVLLYSVVSAACCASQSFYGSTANARKYIYTISSTIWRGDIESAMGSYGEGPAIDSIGWTYWRVYEKCNGSVIEETDRDPMAAHNVAYQARSYQQAFNTCGGTKVAGNKGTHEFKEAGLTTVYLFTDHTQNFP